MTVAFFLSFDLVSNRVTRLGDFLPFGPLFTLSWFLKITADFWANLYYSKIYALILAKNGLGNILGDFVTNSSGHPGFKP
jgi:hypothetical protein